MWVFRRNVHFLLLPLPFRSPLLTAGRAIHLIPNFKNKSQRVTDKARSHTCLSLPPPVTLLYPNIGSAVDGLVQTSGSRGPCCGIVYLNVLEHSIWLKVVQPNLIWDPIKQQRKSKCFRVPYYNLFYILVFLISNCGGVR